MKLRKIYPKYIILLLAAILVSSQIDADTTELAIIEYGAVYELKMSKVPLRIEILREVTATDGQKKIAVFKASSAFFEIDQKSTFTLNRGEIVSSEYFYRKRTLGKTDSQSFTLAQDISLSEPTSARGKFGKNIFDKLSVQYQLQIDLIQEEEEEKEIKIGRSFSYRVQDKGSLKPYRFVVAGIDKIDTQLGTLRTLRIIRERKKENRSTMLWLAPKYKYTLVKMIQREKGKNWQLDIKDWSKKR